jgi:GAF domain-containing protein
MIVARKILIPTLFFFAAVLLGLGVLFANAAEQRTRQEEANDALRFEQAVAAQFARQNDLATTFAVQLAATLAEQSSLGNAFAAGAAGDRSQALELADRLFERARTLHDQKSGSVIALLEFHTPSTRLFATTFEATDTQRIIGQDQAAFRASVVAANTNETPVSGIELTPAGLFTFGVAPVQISGQYLGSLDIGLAIDRTFVGSLKSTYGSDWSISLRRQNIDLLNQLSSIQDGPVFTPAFNNGPIQELVLYAATRLDPIYGESDAYWQALSGQTMLSQAQRGSALYRIISIPLRDYSGRIIGVIDVVSDRSVAQAEQRQQFSVIAGLSLGALILGGLGLAWIIRRILQPVQELTLTAAAIAQGDVDRVVAAPIGLADDEIKQLYVSIGTMTRHTRSLLSRLEQRVAERTRELETRSLQLQAASEIARDISAAAGARRASLEDILQGAVMQIRNRFDLYQVSLFLVESAPGGESFAVLHAAAGQAGKQLVEKGLRLNLAQPGIVSSAVRSGEARIVEDVEKEEGYIREALLPDTRSEIVVPLRGEGQGDRVSRQEAGRARADLFGRSIVGVLDVQNRQVGTFDENDAATLQIIADQLAVAIQNRRLITQLNRTIGELEKSSGQFTLQAWQNFLTETASGELSYQFEGASDLADRHEGQDGAHGAILNIPLRVREQIIGNLELTLETPEASPEITTLAEEAASRLGLVLESTRLLQEARRLAQREQLIGQIAAAVRSNLDIDGVLQTAVQSMSQALTPPQADGSGSQEQTAASPLPPIHKVEIRLGTPPNTHTKESDAL